MKRTKATEPSGMEIAQREADEAAGERDPRDWVWGKAMVWITRGNRHISPPYHIHSSIKGWQLWLNTDAKYGILARELASLAAAKDFAEKHSKEVA